MWELDHKEGWALKSWCFWTVILEKTLESPSDCKEIKPFNPKGNQPWIFIGRTDAEAEISTLWPPYVNSWFTENDLDAGEDRRQLEKGATEDEMVGQHHWFNGCEFAQAPGDGEGQRSLECCNLWGHKSQTWLNEWRITKKLLQLQLQWYKKFDFTIDHLEMSICRAVSCVVGR